MKPIETVGILGLGKMGGPIAGHLVARGFKVIGYDPVEERYALGGEGHEHRPGGGGSGAPQPAARRHGQGDDQRLEDPHGARHAGDSGAPLARHASPQARNAGSDGLTPSGKLATLTSCRELAHGYVDVRPAGSGSEDTWRLTVT